MAPRQGDALTLTTGQFGRAAIQQGTQFNLVGGFLHALLARRLVHTAQFQRVFDVLAHGHVRIETVVLEHHRDVAILGRLVVDLFAADHHVAGGDFLKPCDHPHGRGLATA